MLVDWFVCLFVGDVCWYYLVLVGWLWACCFVLFIAWLLLWLIRLGWCGCFLLLLAMFASLFYVVCIVTVLIGAVACLIAVLVLFISLSGFIIVFCRMWLFRFDCLLLLVLFCCLLISVLRCWVWFALIVGGLLLCVILLVWY